MTRLPSPLLAPVGQAYQAAKLRRAVSTDRERLRLLFDEARPGEREDETTMASWLDRGGALLMEDEGGKVLCAVRWREGEGGWLVDRVCTLPSARGLGFGRWLMTKVEAQAIRDNIPALTVYLPDSEMTGYYRRLGYRLEQRQPGLVAHKRVGGTWQLRGRVPAGEAEHPDPGGGDAPA